MGTLVTLVCRVLGLRKGWCGPHTSWGFLVQVRAARPALLYGIPRKGWQAASYGLAPRSGGLGTLGATRPRVVGGGLGLRSR